MRKNYFGKILLLTFIIASAFAACRENDKQNAHADHSAVQQYTCSMHPQITSDTPGNCPVCGMDLVPMASGRELRVDSAVASLTKPVNERIVATIPAILPDSGTRIFSVEAQGIMVYDTRKQTGISSRVSGRIERLYIKYNFQPVQNGQLIMEIYSPELAAAQRELLYIARAGDKDLLQKARQRLSLLGMRPSQINEVLKTGTILYQVPVYSNAGGYILEKNAQLQATGLPTMPVSSSSGNDPMDNMGSRSSRATVPLQAQPVKDNTPVLIREGLYVSAGQSLFTVYSANSLVADFAFRPEFAATIRKGDKLVFHSNSNKDEVYSGTIGLIEPVVNNGQRFTVARVYLQNTSLKPGELITAYIPVITQGWWLPAEAVWKTGNKSIVFKKENNVYVPVEVKTGLEVQGMVNVISSIRNWEVAKNASFLVDGESFIKSEARRDQ